MNEGQTKPRKIAVVQRYLPHYRVDGMDELVRRLAEHNYELQFFFSFYMGKAKTRAWQRKLWGVKRELQLGELQEAAVLSPTLFFHLVKYKPDLLLLEGVSGLPNTSVAALYARLFRRPYLIWSLGRVPNKKTSRLRGLLNPLIQWVERNASGFVCYSSFAQKICRATGKPAYLALNAVLPRPTEVQISVVHGAIHRREQSQAIRLCSIGILKKQKRLDVLLEAMAQLKDLRVELDVIGDGPERRSLEKTAEELGVADRIHFHGALYDRIEKESILLGAHIGVLPGRGGLSIQEMMTYGLPVISGVADGTEQDLLQNGKNGYLLEGFPTVEALVTTIRRYQSLTVDERTQMSLAALDVVHRKSNSQVFAQSIVEAILRTDNCVPENDGPSISERHRSIRSSSDIESPTI